MHQLIITCWLVHQEKPAFDLDFPVDHALFVLFVQDITNLCANGFHAFNLFQPLPLLFLSEEGKQATKPLLTLGMVQLIQIVVPESHASML